MNGTILFNNFLNKYFLLFILETLVVLLLGIDYIANLINLVNAY